MSDSKAKKAPIRIPDWLLESLKDEQYALRKATGKEPPYGDLLASRMRRLEKLELGSSHSVLPPSPAPPKVDPDHRMLDVILKKGTKDQILGIRSNLQAFNEAIELRELKATKSPHRKTASG